MKLFAVWLAVPLAIFGTPCFAQAAQSAPPQISGSTPWGALNSVQQQALAPLSNSWTMLSEGQRRKWIAVAQGYPSLPPEDQGKLHSRMVEWAALSPKDRELARLNFAKTKSVAKPDRAANWEAYQALSDEEKKKLASSAETKPTGAAVTPKPVASEKLTVVPVTRRTPEGEKALSGPKIPLDRNTLLPQKAPLRNATGGESAQPKP